MSDLDDKLREILQGQTGSEFRPEVWDEAIAQIKQAFAGEGWLPPVPAGAGIVMVETMTGQEWYERFEKELPGIKISTLALDGDYQQLMRSEVLKIAKKTSGIE